MTVLAITTAATGSAMLWLNSAADAWFAWMRPMAWHGAILFLVIAVIAWLLRDRSARMRYAIWLLVPLRFVIPPTLALATGWGWWLLPAVENESTTAAPPVAVAQMTEVGSSQLIAMGADMQRVTRESDRYALMTHPSVGAQVANANSKAGDSVIVAPPVESAPAPASSIPLVTWLFCGWTLGALFFSLRLIVGWACARSIVRRASTPRCMLSERSGGATSPVGGDNITELVDACRRRIGLRRPVRVRELADAGVPMLIGVVRPTIVLPAGLDERLSREELEAVLVHELQHVARHDALVQFLQALLGAVYFFHPAMWLANRSLNRLREDACDEATVATLDGRRRDYGTGIVKVAGMMSRRAPVLSLGVVSSGSQVKRRLGRILDPRLPVGRRLSWSAVACLLVIAAVVLPAAARPGDAAPKDETPKAAGPATKSEAPADKSAPAEKVAKPADPQKTLRGSVVDEQNAPVEGALVFVDWYKGRAETHTNSKGQFELIMSDKALTSASMVRVLAGAGERQAHYRLSKEARLDDVQLKLAPARRVELQVVDGAGQPISGAKAGALADYPTLGSGETGATGKAFFWVPADVPVVYVYALKAGHGLDYRAYVTPRGQSGDKNVKAPKAPDGPIQLTLDGAKPLKVRVIGADDAPIAGINVYPWYVTKPDQPEDLNLSFFTDVVQAATDAQGVVSFDWMPKWQEGKIGVWPTSDDYSHQRGTYDPKTDDGKLTIQLHRLVPLRGQVKLPDGSPAANIQVVASGKGHDFDDFHGNVKTDAEGRYEIKAAPNVIYLVTVQDKKWASTPHTGFAVWPDTPVNDVDFTLRPATRLFGRVTLGPEQRPVKDQWISVYQYGVNALDLKGVELPNPKKSTWSVQPILTQGATTDADGKFEVFVGAGKFDIRGPSQAKVEKFEITDEPEKEFNFNSPRPEKGILRGTVVTGDPQQGVAEAEVEGIYRHSLAPGDMRATTGADGTFEVERALHRTVIHARNKDKTLAGVVQIEPDDMAVTVPLRPMATASGRLIEQVSDQPLANREIVYGVRVHIGDDKAPWRTSFGGSATTNDKGEFALKDLILDQRYEISVTIPSNDNPSNVSWQGVGNLEPNEAKNFALGDLKLTPPYKPPTLEERIAKEFVANRKPLDRFESAKDDAELSRQRVLILFGTPAGADAKQFLKLYFEDREVGRAMDSFKLVAVDTSADKLADAKQLAVVLSQDLDAARQSFSLVIASDDGTLIGSAAAGAVQQNGAVTKEKLLEFLKSQTPAPLDARQLFKDALAQAKADNKRVFVHETATWCGPCHMLSRFLEANRPAWEKDYIWIKIDQRWTGADELMKELRQGAKGGIPWCVILDADGKQLATSTDPEGENIGFPSSDSGRKHFRTMLERSAIRLTADEITALVEATKAARR